MAKKMSEKEYRDYVNRTVLFHGGKIPNNELPKASHAKLIDEINTPEELAHEIVEHPNLWGMYSISEAIRKLINLTHATKK